MKTIQIVERDLEAIAEGFVARAAEAGGKPLTKSAALNLLTRTLLGPGHDWGAIRNAPEETLLSQRCRSATVREVTTTQNPADTPANAGRITVESNLWFYPDKPVSVGLQTLGRGILADLENEIRREGYHYHEVRVAEADAADITGFDPVPGIPDSPIFPRGLRNLDPNTVLVFDGLDHGKAETLDAIRALIWERCRKARDSLRAGSGQYLTIIGLHDPESFLQNLLEEDPVFYQTLVLMTA